MNNLSPKIGRATKGGSLPSTVGARALADVLSRYFSRSELTEACADKPRAIDRRAEQTVSLNGNGATSPSLLTRTSDLRIYRGVAADVERSEIPRWKRILDVTLVSLTLPCWLPLMILIMGAIRFTSRGPVFYRQERIGYRRRRFMMFKFRTMRVGAETKTHEEYYAYLMRADCPMAKLDAHGEQLKHELAAMNEMSGPVFKLTNDPRITPVGRFLRKFSLDEFPQLFNVVRGEMSLVGPRPCLPSEFQRYEKWQRKRVNGLPGLTGYWQVNGKNETTFSEMVAMDLFYLRNMSPWRDLVIIFKTVPALIGQALESRKRLRRRSRPANCGSDLSAS